MIPEFIGNYSIWHFRKCKSRAATVLSGCRFFKKFFCSDIISFLYGYFLRLCSVFDSLLFFSLVLGRLIPLICNLCLLQNIQNILVTLDFPESLLSQITQQRKQRVCILASSQVFTRVAKPLREQCFIVVECKTIAGRYTKLKYINADDYLSYADNPTPKNRLKLKKRKIKTFVQTDILRACYDSYEIISRLSRDGFRPKLPDVDITINNHVVPSRRK